MYQSVAQVKAGNWNWRNGYQGDELAGKTLGILGLGNIGFRVASLAEAFGMKVVYWNRSEKHTPYQALALEEVLQQADVVSLHLPLTSATEEILGEKELALLPPHALLINTARGSLVNQTALVKALDAGTLAGYGADVLTTEPPAPDDPLAQHPRALITPHVGSLTTTTYVQMCVQTVQNVLAVLGGEPPVPESIFNRNSLQKEIKPA
jgi:D-3-phosphoglycerate dehydrogenase